MTRDPVVPGGGSAPAPRPPWYGTDTVDRDEDQVETPGRPPWSRLADGTPSGTPSQYAPDGTPGGGAPSASVQPLDAGILPMPWLARGQGGADTLQSALWFEEGEGGGQAVAVAASPPVASVAGPPPKDEVLPAASPVRIYAAAAVGIAVLAGVLGLFFLL